MMMATRNDIKDRLIHNQSPYPTKDKVLSYTIPVDHTESLLFCNKTTSSQDNGSLTFNTSDDDPCNGRDSLASFLDEGLGTSLDGVDEIASPIFPTLGRNDSGVFSSDEVTAGALATVGSTTPPNTHNHASLIPPPISSSNSTCSNISSGSGASGLGLSNNNIISVAEVVSWKGTNSSSSSGGASSSSAPSNILLSPTTTTTISVVTDSATGIPSIICTSAAPNTNNNSSSGGVPTIKLEARQVNSSSLQGQALGGSGKSNLHQQPPPPVQQQQRCKSMPLGRQGPQKCTICDKVFSNASALTKHKLTHSDERRHACATCGKAFKRQDHLNGHMLTHRNKKPFECKSKGCGKSYCDARSLRRHVENRHGHEVLESMNLTSHHKHKNNHSHHNNNSINNNCEQPQPELVPTTTTVTFTPVKVELSEQLKENRHDKILDCMPVLQPERPQLQLESCPEKISVSVQPPPPLLQKAGESSAAVLPPAGNPLPIVLKRENVSVFDFDESVEDAPVPFAQEKILSSISNSTIKVSNIIDSSKLGPLPDIRLIQEWTKRLGDSKVALFLASSSAASSIAQLAGPMPSIQLDGQTSSVAMPGASHAFIPSNENGLFSVTPISLVPTSSGEFTFKPATISMPTSESHKPLYIVPSEPLLPTVPHTISVSAPIPVSSTLPPLSTTSNVKTGATPLPVPKQERSSQKGSSKESKSKGEKEKKSGIGPTLANRIKTKLKAGSLKKLAKQSANSSAPLLSTNGSTTLKSGKDFPKQSPAIVISRKSASDDGGGKVVVMPALQQMQPSMPTIAITAGTGLTTWCESPKDCLMNGTEEDRLSEGADGEDKPVECSICCRRFKNTPALNGHMRLHGGYFKKETEGSKKKDQVSKEPTHSTPLQTASVSVRALIEEKIKERRNNLLKLAAAAAAEKSANEGTVSNEASSQSGPVTTHVEPVSKTKSERNSDKVKSSPPACATGNNKSCTIPIAQQPKLLENVKLKLEPLEKDRNCDHDTNIISTNDNSGGTASSEIDPSFQDLSVLIGDGVIGGVPNGANELLPSLVREPVNGLNTYPIDKSNFTLLDCGINPEDLCQAFHLIYVDNNGTDLPLTMDQETLGKVSKMFQDPLPELSLPGSESMNDNQNIKEVGDPVVCATQDDPCNLPWEWRNSTSSENTDNSLSNVQDCVNSLLCSSSSETPEESTKDPVAGGGYCYTPILSPNSTFCLTPGPDSPFEATNHSLSFICPSPSIGSGPSFAESSSLINPPSMEPLFSTDQPLSNNPINISVNISSSSGPIYVDSLPKLSQMNQQSVEHHMFLSAFDSIVSQLPQQISNYNSQPNGNSLDCLPTITSFSPVTKPLISTSSTNDFCKIENNFGPTLISTSPKDIVLHCPVNNGTQQAFVPYEVFTPVSLPKKISGKWASGKMEKNKKINVGLDYQAEIPNFRGNKGKNKTYRSMDEKLWDPSILDTSTSEEVDKYLEFACCSAVPGGGMNKEYALHLLMLSRGNIREAILRLMEKLPSLPPKLRSYTYVENQRWTSEEIMAFQISLVQAGKDFTRISKGIGTKSLGECVSFYYFWKKVCPSEYLVMRQIWMDRLEHQQSQTLQSVNVGNNSNSNVSFLVPAQEYRSIFK